jgi:dCTP deaminase
MLNAAEIRDLSKNPNVGLRIVPLLESGLVKNSGTASIDLRLGCWFMQLQTERCRNFDFGRNHEISEDFLSNKYYVAYGNSFVLHPRSFVLAATLEWITLPKMIGGYVTGKSSLGRRGLVIETAPGVHPQFMGCLTLELANVGEVPLILQPGMPICQLFLHKITSPEATGAYTRFRGERQPRLGKYLVDDITLKLSK